MADKKATYNQAADGLRVLAILAVLMIHTTTRTLEMTGFNLERTKWTLLLNQSARFAVPLFFMISGFVLELSNQREINYREYFNKRVSRFFVPYIFWSAIYYYFVYKKHSMGFGETLLSGSASYQLYFIPTLLIFYTIYPLLHKGYKLLENKLIFIILGLLELRLLYVSYFGTPLTWFYPISIAILNYYFFVVGMVAAHHQQQLKETANKLRYVLTAATILLAEYVFWEGITEYEKTHNYLMFYSQWRPSIMAYTLTLAGTAYFLFNKLNWFPKTIKEMSKVSFFVFFVHVFILEWLWQNIGLKLFAATNTKIADQLWYDPIYFALTAIISFGLATAVHKIPILAKLTG